MDYLKNRFGVDWRKRLSKDQQERLYPENQPTVFKRLAEDAENAIKKFDI
jgi:hypothetical protein